MLRNRILDIGVSGGSNWKLSRQNYKHAPHR